MLCCFLMSVGVLLAYISGDHAHAVPKEEDIQHPTPELDVVSLCVAAEIRVPKCSLLPSHLSSP